MGSQIEMQEGEKGDKSFLANEIEVIEQSGAVEESEVKGHTYRDWHTWDPSETVQHYSDEESLRILQQDPFTPEGLHTIKTTSSLDGPPRIPTWSDALREIAGGVLKRMLIYRETEKWVKYKKGNVLYKYLP